MRYPFTVFTVALCLFFGTACGDKISGQTKTFQPLSESGIYCFEGLEKGMSLDEVVKKLNLDKSKLVEVQSGMSYSEPFSFKEFDAKFYPYFYFEEDSRTNFYRGEYWASFDKETEFQTACEQIVHFISEHLTDTPDWGSAENLVNLPGNDKTIVSSAQWADKAQDGSTLAFYFQPMQIDNYASIRIVIDYSR